MDVVAVRSAPTRKFSNNPLVAFYQSSIGKKIVIAITGAIALIYVIGHLIGNLQIFISPERLNAYSFFLHSLGPLLWLIRIFLVAAFVLHIVATVQVTQENRQAKPAKYAVRGYQRSTVASRTMIVSGLIVLCFVVYHLLHFTVMATNPGFRELHDVQGRHDVYRMVVLGFQNPLVSFFYILSLFLLANHLSHGFASLMQTLGINNRKIARGIASIGQVLSWLIFFGYISIPIAVLFGIVR
jgi:succinate dehydrogenase / fumarate reductase, cytochrome b subunit